MRPVRFFLLPISALGLAVAFVTGCPDENTGGGMALVPPHATSVFPLDADFQPLDASVPDVVDGSKPDSQPGPGGTTDDRLPGDGCADGTRVGLHGAAYPDIALCAGVWSGPVSGATFLCEGGWHACT